MDAWELDELEAARTESGRLYHEFISVPDLSGGLYVLEAGATDPQSPHTEDELYVVMAGGATVTVGEEVLEAVDLARPRSELEREFRSATRLVVAEEDEGIVAGSQERLESVEPRVELIRRVVVMAQPEIQERAGTAQRRRRVVVLALGRTQDGACLRQHRGHLIRGPARVAELDGERQITRPRVEQRAKASIVPSGGVWGAEQYGPEPLPEVPIRVGQPWQPGVG
jgi:hypothetical protein